jgi:hypothetical protein
LLGIKGSTIQLYKNQAASSVFLRSPVQFRLSKASSMMKSFLIIAALAASTAALVSRADLAINTPFAAH